MRTKRFKYREGIAAARVEMENMKKSPKAKISRDRIRAQRKQCSDAISTCKLDRGTCTNQYGAGNRGLHDYRFKQNPLEKKFAMAWEKQNVSAFTDKPDGKGTLDYLLAKDCNLPAGEVTARDREVAATVIQWLGSPVGQSFLEDIKPTPNIKRRK
jgi:hypothetical protein